MREALIDEAQPVRGGAFLFFLFFVAKEKGRTACLRNRTRSSASARTTTRGEGAALFPCDP
jgi:hypothetical protein